MFFLLIEICLSEKFFVNITFIKSSVGKSIPTSIKLVNIEFKSFNFILNFFNEIGELIIKYLLSCTAKFIIE